MPVRVENTWDFMTQSTVGTILGKKKWHKTDYSIQRVWEAGGQRLFRMQSVGKNKPLCISCRRWITSSSSVCSWDYNWGATESTCHCFSSEDEPGNGKPENRASCLTNWSVILWRGRGNAPHIILESLGGLCKALSSPQPCTHISRWGALISTFIWSKEQNENN